MSASKSSKTSQDKSEMDTSDDQEKKKDQVADELNLDSMTKSDKFAEAKDIMQTDEYKKVFDKAEPFMIEDSKQQISQFKDMMTSEGQLELKREYEYLVDSFTGEKKDLLQLLSRHSISVESKTEKEKKEKENKHTALQCDWCKKGLTLSDANDNGLLGIEERRLVFKRESHALPYIKDSLDICADCVKIPAVVNLINDLKSSGVYIVRKTVDGYADLFINTICNTLVGLSGEMTAQQIRNLTKVVHNALDSIGSVSLKWWTEKKEAQKHNGGKIMFDLKIPTMWWLINLAAMTSNIAFYDKTPKAADDGVLAPPAPPAPGAPIVPAVPIAAGDVGAGAGAPEQKVRINVHMEMDDSFNVQLKKTPITNTSEGSAAENGSSISNNPMQEKLDVWPELLNNVKLCLEELPLGLMETIYHSWTDFIMELAKHPEMMEKIIKTLRNEDPLEVDLINLTDEIKRL